MRRGLYGPWNNLSIDAEYGGMAMRMSLAGIGVCVLVGFQSVSLTADASPPSGGQGEYGVDAGGVIPDYVPGRLLVKFKPGVGAEKRKTIIANQNAQEIECIPGIDVRIIELPVQANEKACMAAFRGRREVEFAELDEIVEPALIPNDPLYAPASMPQWHLPAIGCPTAWDITTGSSNITIAILDSGVYGDHEDLQSKMVSGWNVRDGNGDTSDINGHGTAVAGTAAGASNNGIGIASPAWGCRIMPIMVTDEYGFTSTSYLASGLIWAADHGARVANMSQAYIRTSTLSNAAQYFEDHTGGIVTMSIGNSPVASAWPDDAVIITVSATTQDDAHVSWTTTGDCVDLAAPGVSIITTSRTGAYTSGSGTSFSAPVVSGVAALVMSVNPDLTGQQIQDILKQSADDLGPNGWDPTYGWGRINAAQAVQMAVSYGGGTPVDTTPPDVQFSSPTQSETVTGLIDVTMTATDDTRVGSVSLDIDGVEVGTDTSAPYVFAWDTAEANNGSHTLTATAVDSAGNEAWAQITVAVDNPVADTTPPSINMDSPTDNSAVSGTVTLQASASDNVGVTSVIFRADGELVGTDNSAPYSASWDTSGLPNGTCVLTATALDGAGNAADALATVTVDNVIPDTESPTVAVDDPTDGSTVSGKVIVQISASDDTAVAWVSLTIDGVSLGTDTSAPYSFVWNTEAFPAGTCTLTAVAADAAGNTAESSVWAIVDNSVAEDDTTPPTIRITSPADGSIVTKPTVVQVSTSDDVGVTKVELYVDGKLTSSSTDAPIFKMRWNPKKVSKGLHTLQCRAYDATGNVGTSAAITVDTGGDDTSTASTDDVKVNRKNK